MADSETIVENPPSTDTGTSSDASATATTEGTSILTSSSQLTTTEEGTTTETSTAKVDEGSEKESAAPESYELTLPEDSDLDEKFVNSIADYAKENGFSQEQAQAQLTREAGMVNKFLDAQKEVRSEQESADMAAVKADPDIGGTHFDTTVANVSGLINKYGDAEAIADIDASGLGNKLSIVRMFNNIAKAGAEAAYINGQKKAAEVSDADLFYGDNK